MTTKPGDYIHACLDSIPLLELQARVTSIAFRVAEVTKDGCHVDSVFGNGTITFRSWIRASNYYPK